jgi:hypothetical protein
MNNTPTPETDAARITEKNGCIATFGVSQVVSVNFARKLERELAEAREALRAVLELANDIPDESLDDWKIRFHKVLEEAK